MRPKLNALRGCGLIGSCALRGEAERLLNSALSAELVTLLTVASGEAERLLNNALKERLSKEIVVFVEKQRKPLNSALNASQEDERTSVD